MDCTLRIWRGCKSADVPSPRRDGRLEGQLPGFGDQVFSSPAVVWLLGGSLESRLFVEMARGVEFALRPEDDPFISSPPGKVHAFGNQARADTQSPRAGFDQEQPQLGHSLGFLDEKDRSDWLFVFFRHPAVLTLRIQILDELSHDPGDQRFEAFVVAVFLPVKNAMPLNDPAQVPWPVLAKDVCRLWLRNWTLRR